MSYSSKNEWYKELRKETKKMPLKKVGFIGLGEMGSPMAKNLLNKGFDLTVFDVRKEAVEELRELGARSSGSPQELAEASDVIISMVRDDAQTREIFHGNNGIWKGAKKGSIILLTSTIDPSHVRQLAAEGLEKRIKVLDTPVSGMRTGAEAGTLTVMVGGDKADFEKCMTIFQAIGKNVYYIGTTGMAASLKLINSLMGCINLACLSEAIRLGLKVGLDLDVLINVVKVSTGTNWPLQNFDLVLKLINEFRENRRDSTFNTLYKDVGLALKMAKEMEQFVPVAALCSQMDIADYFLSVER